MAGTVDRVLGEALKLAPHERALIVAELLATLEPDTPSDQRTEADWIQELERRARGHCGHSWSCLDHGARPDSEPTPQPLSAVRLSPEAD